MSLSYFENAIKTFIICFLPSSVLNNSDEGYVLDKSLSICLILSSKLRVSEFKFSICL